MLCEKPPQHVLIVSSAEKGAAYISELLNPRAYDAVAVAKSGTEARRMLISETYELVVINAPLSDEFGHELAIRVAEDGASGVILIVKNELFDEICHRVGDDGVLTVAKPVSRHLFYQAVKLLEAVQARWRKLEKENRKLQVKLEEIRIVARAKCILMEYLNMSEGDAHRYIEKQAMDLRTTKKTVAENVLKTYDH
ncbi:ANTAR domain-containing response regulator [Yeguia hominis]|uniref:ANTAR domain-containing protein n=1 Tax=Yeguia hominis TaxID=2763662 RepID=A0A926HQL0_9FIRM|nr:ANTAR domain-containing protein [Yeguia hominis]MBC8532849.1 ANTAR domain-containing protein [Yeguia hominis]